MRPLTRQEKNGVLVIVVDDVARVNDSLSDEYRQEVYRAAQEFPGGRVALDLGPVDFISSSGVTMLVGLQKRMLAAKGRLVLFHAQPYVRDVLHQMRIDKLFTFAADEPEALGLLAPSPA
ncbi:MAG: STAS domain-containing protein [Isosphaeraceae bacterium]|nr:STAS domain-containing protein [Isosphaeraceae bacterium]